MNIPADNKLTAERIELGKLLFFDKRLSRDSSISCASCHRPEHAFSDTVSISAGIEGRHAFRNAISLGNVGYQPYMFDDGGVPVLELQVITPLESHNEMGFNIPAVIKRLATDKNYQQLAQKAYTRNFDFYVFMRAIASYERTLLSGNSRYDRYHYFSDKSALNDTEIKGMNLFFSNRTNCSTCHSGFNFTDYSFRDAGLYETYTDSGRARITIKHADNGKFKVPSLRNVELTAPYMHDGSMATLEQVVEHFNNGGKNHFNQDTLVRPLNLTTEEKRELVSFLKTLTDKDFIKSQ